MRVSCVRVRRQMGMLVFPLALCLRANKKVSCLQDTTPAAGRLSDILPYRRSAILAKRFLFYRKLRFHRIKNQLQLIFTITTGLYRLSILYN